MADGAPAVDPASLFEGGNVCFERGDVAGAIASFRRCLAVVPGHAGANYNLGNALLTAGRPVEAIDAFLECLRAQPAFGPAFVNLAEALRQLGLLDKALWAAELGVQHLPAAPEAHIVRAATRHDNCDYAAAEAGYRQVLAAVPEHSGVWSSLGNTLHAMGRLDEALEAHDRALSLAPQVPEVRFSRAVTLLALGDYGRGWAEYEWRWRRTQAQPRGFAMPAWRGESIAGSTILLHAEQGLGDTLQFVRYAPLVAQRGARVVLEVQPPLVRLLRGTAGIEHVVPRGHDLPLFDVQCPLLSLPYVFGTLLDTIPDAPYLRAEPRLVASWGRRLRHDGRFRVGLVWAGSAHNDDAGAHLIDSRRSTTLAALAPLGDVPGIRLVSLQKHDRAADPTVLAPLTVLDLMAEVADFADTAALVANLDLVISVDTSVAHLAGGLGKPTWLLSRYDGCWRWLHGRTDSPWYPGMRIYRQQRPHDWSDVIASVARDLAAAAGGAGSD